MLFFRLSPEFSRLMALRKIEEVPDMYTAEKQALPWWQKYTLTLEEAAEYFGISYKKLRLFCKSHADEDFLLWNGNRALIKREQFEKYLDTQMTVI